ncbi:MAG: hydrogenase maturation protease [Candidatus Omnitrophica bacterium]|nr:hydrogenase maturation protease [Candidatus Omnitrophota bacterium]
MDLKDILKGKVVIVGIGNPLRSDDGAGVELVRRLSGQIDAVCIDAGTSPENYLGKISKLNPDVVLFIDAVDLNQKPGTYRVLEKEDLLQRGFSTHDISPKILIEQLRAYSTNLKIYMLGIQPQSLEFGTGLSLSVEKTVDELVKHFKHEEVIQSLIQGILEHALKESAKSVTRLHLKIGFLTGIKEEAFHETFQALSKGTLLENARLEITFFPGTRIEVISFDIE